MLHEICRIRTPLGQVIRQLANDNFQCIFLKINLLYFEILFKFVPAIAWHLIWWAITWTNDSIYLNMCALSRLIKLYVY